MKELSSLTLFALVAYLALALLLFIFQRSFLYYPSPQLEDEASLNALGLRQWPSTDDFRGIASLNDKTNAKGTVIVFHGNAGSAYHRSFYIDALSQQNLRVILAEYPGYAGRSGKLSEESLVEDALKTVNTVYETYGSPIYLWGESLGAGVVSSVIAKTDTPIEGIVLFTPWDSLADVAQTHYWYLPARWLVRDKYQSVENLKSYEGNIAVILAEYDQVIPIKHGQRLFESITSNKKVWLFQGAGHNTIPVSPSLDWWEEVGAFISK